MYEELLSTNIAFNKINNAINYLLNNINNQEVQSSLIDTIKLFKEITNNKEYKILKLHSLNEAIVEMDDGLTILRDLNNSHLKNDHINTFLQQVEVLGSKLFNTIE